MEQNAEQDVEQTPVRWTSWKPDRSQQRLRGGIQQNRFADRRLLASSRQAICGMDFLEA
jgi:hypothetical protein